MKSAFCNYQLDLLFSYTIMNLHSSRHFTPIQMHAIITIITST